VSLSVRNRELHGKHSLHAQTCPQALTDQNRQFTRPEIIPRWTNWIGGEWAYSSPWRDRFRLMETLLVRAVETHAAAVSPKQVQLGTHRGALRMWIPEDDSKCMVWHFLYSF
jgi:hypothetical protein